MVSSRFLSMLLSLILLLMTMMPENLAQSAYPPFLDHFCINERGNYTANSTYHENLKTLLSSLPSSTGNGAYGFYNSSYGSGESSKDEVYTIGLCRGDVQLNDCRSCLNDSIHALPEICPNQKEALGWYDFCMLRYSNRSIYGMTETRPAFYLWNVQNVSASSLDGFNQELRKLLERLKSEAATGGSLRKFAIGNTSSPGFITIYALVQCTPDISELECNDCLDGAFGDIPICCDGKRGGRVVGPSCNFRYEAYRFFSTSVVALPSPPLPSPISPPPSTNTSTSPTGPKSNKSSARTVVIIVVPIVITLALIISLYVCLKVRKRKEKLEILPGEDTDEIRTPDSLQFDFDTIRVATNNFSEANKLGQGGFGSVYKGRLLNGEDIAVKRLSINSGQGDLEFKNEVLLVAKLQHRNLVRLLGFCLERNERLLVYEFVPNTSLDHIIFDRTKREQLDWAMRYKIIVGITRGLLYLHEDSRLRIIHRDLKASNILIDAELNPKISDFGMAKLFVLDQTQGNTSRIVGTYGYMAPEYAMHGQFSVKSDVYSFGVLVLEMVSGQKNNCFRQGENVEDLLSYAWKSWREGTASKLIDPTLRNGSRTEIMRCIHIGLLCVQDNIADRPTMASIILMLNSYSLRLPLPSQPAFFMHSNVGSDMRLGWEDNSGVTGSSDRSKSNSAKASDNEVSYTELYPR
ncbi:cysteine-rich receptor-like protein kinase 29 [Rosa sericea]